MKEMRSSRLGSHTVKDDKDTEKITEEKNENTHVLNGENILIIWNHWRQYHVFYRSHLYLLLTPKKYTKGRENLILLHIT